VLSAMAAAWACERSYGIARSAKLASYPSPDCIIRAVEHVAEVETFDEHHEPNEKLVATQRFQNLSYRGLGVEVELGVFEEGNQTRFVQSHLYVNRRPAPSDIEAARTLMRAVEEKMAESCSIPGLGGMVREHCTGVECD
jgi:hypothetical protein